MGSVAKVKKRADAIGGSARKELVEQAEKEARLEACFSFPIVGGLFQFCMKGKRDDSLLSDASNDTGHSFSLRYAVPSSETESASSPSTAKQHAEVIYAMKSIHLSRVDDPSFVEELKNAINILKSLDHPHIGG